MKVKLYRLVISLFDAINVIDQAKIMWVTRKVRRMSSLSILKELIKALSNLITILVRKRAHRDSYRIASFAWRFGEDLDTQWTHRLVKARDIIRKKFAKRSRKWWMSSSKLKRAVKTGTI